MRLIRFVEKFFVLFPLLLTFTSSIPDKVCKGGILDSGNIDRFKNCTKIDGNLYIKNVSFTGEISKMDPSELEVFSTVKEITGLLSVTASHPDFTDLRYFRNLQIIGEMEYMVAVEIKQTSLKSFGLRSLKRISGVISINDNHNLCFTEGINWRKLRWRDYDILVQRDLFGPPIYSNIRMENNRPKDACRADNMVCHEECSEDGCWGPGVDECLSCKNFTLDSTCLDSCFHPGIYQSGDLTCAKCHEECDGICTGPGPGNCTKCKRVKNRRDCVASCPSMTYEMNGDCVQCNEKCVAGCTGPGDFIGSEGCDAWDKGIVRYNNPIQTDARGRSLKTDEPCKEGHFSELINVTGTTKSLKSNCRPCHPRCKNCTGYGIHLSVCNECAQFRSEEQCEDRYPNGYYTDYAAKTCIRCSSECKGCSGPGSDRCESCRNLKVPLGDNITHEFNCSDTCPEDKPRTRQDQDGPYCSADPVKKIYIDVPAIVGGVLGCTFLIGIFAALFVYQWRQRARSRENTVKMTMEMAELEESDLLNTSHVDSNHAQLRIFEDDELCNKNILKYGALGDSDPVYATDEQVDKADGAIVNRKVSRSTSPLHQYESIVSEDLTVDSQQGSSGGGPASQFMAAELPILQLDESAMWSIAEYLANKDWIGVGQNLNVRNNRLDEIDSKHKHDYRECALQMLRTWCDHNPNCTLRDLFDALKQLGMESSIVKIKGIDFSKHMTHK